MIDDWEELKKYIIQKAFAGELAMNNEQLKVECAKNAQST